MLIDCVDIEHMCWLCVGEPAVLACRIPAFAAVLPFWLSLAALPHCPRTPLACCMPQPACTPCHPLRRQNPRRLDSASRTQSGCGGLTAADALSVVQRISNQAENMLAKHSGHLVGLCVLHVEPADVLILPLGECGVVLFVVALKHVHPILRL